MKKIAKKIAKKFGIKKKASIRLMKQVKDRPSFYIGNSYAEEFGIDMWEVRALIQKLKE